MISNIEESSLAALERLYFRQEPNQALHINSVVEPDVTDDEADQIAVHLDNKGLVEIMSFGPRVTITQEGVSFIQAVQTKRQDPAVRIPELRSRMLRYLEGARRRGERADWGSFLEADASLFLGERFSETEVQDEAKSLHDHGLIASALIDEAPDGWVGPGLTTAGRDCVIDHGGSVTEFKRSRLQPGINIGHVSGGNVSIGGANFSQVSNQGEDVDALLRFARGLTGRLPELCGITGDERERLRTYAEQIDTAAQEPTRDPGKLKQLVGGALTVLKAAATSVARDTLIGLGHEAANEFGIPLS